MFEGYLELGGGEVLNSARSLGYTRTAPCPVSWLQCPPCDGVQDVLGDEDYTFANIEDAPWYDVEDEVTHRFLGAHALTIEGIPDSTREASVAEGILDGGVVGRVRHATRRMRVRAILSAQGEDALEAGFSWLDAALRPGRCGTHGDACGAADARFFVACPPTRESITKPDQIYNSPITNLAINPSFEAGAAAVAVRTNLATNPSFEASTATTVEVRRNLLLNPKMDNTILNWSVSAANGVVQTAEAGGTRLTFNTALPSGATAVLYNSAAAPGLPAESQYAAMDITVPVGQPAITVALAIKSYDVNISIDGTAATANTTIQPGETKRLVTPVLTLPATTVGTRIWLNVTTPGVVVGQYIKVAKAIIERLPINTEPYFDGTSVPAGDFTFAWTGTVNSSPSVQYGLWPTGPGGIIGNTVQSTDWASSGTKSMRQLANQSSGSNQTRATLTPTLTVAAGQVYTAIIKMRLTAPLTGTLWANALKLSFYFSDTATLLYSDAAQNVAGVQELRFTVTVPAGNTKMDVRANSGAPPWGGDVWWDDFLLVAGDYTGPYFDGTTPARIRKNLVANPNFGYGSITGWGSYWSPSRTLTTDNPYPGGNGKSMRVGKATDTHTAQGTNTSQYRGWFAEGDTLHGIVRLRGEIGAQMDIGFRTSSGGATGGLVNVIGDGEWHEYEFSMVATPGNIANGVGLQINVDNSNTWPENTPMFQIDSALLANETSGAYFDPDFPIAPYVGGWIGTVGNSASHLMDGDLTYAWTGTANASTSQQKIATVASYNAAAAIDGQSTVWHGNRSKSLRLISTATARGVSYLDIANNLTPNGLEVGKTYTMSVLLHLEQVAGFTRSIALYGDSGPIVTTDGSDSVGQQALTLTFTVPSGGWSLRIVDGGMAGDPNSWWDDLIIVEGTGGQAYFDGSFADSGDVNVIGDRLNDYEWVGAADASASTHVSGSVIAVPDPVAYELAIERLIRNLHTVTCTGGPIVVQKLHRGDTWGYIVEFILVAAVPWIFGITRSVALEPSLPVVVQDVPFNLVPYPSAELALGTVIAATNYSDNPSVETGLTNWAKGGNVPQADVVLSQGDSAAGGLASVGTKSAKVRFTATTTSAVLGNLRVENTSATFAAAAGQRMSVNMWATPIKVSGTAVLGELRIYAIWRAGTTQLSADLVGTAPAGGGAVSKKSMVVPPTATNVIIRAELDVTSWSTGAVIDLYADAVAVTVP